MSSWNLLRPAAQDVRPLIEEMLREAARELALHGFRRSGSDFRWQSVDCQAIIIFQKHRGNTKQTQAFTVNLGIASKRVLTFENLACDRPPKEYQCCWRRRLAEMSPPETDRWWTVTSASTARSVWRDVRDSLLEKALPKMAPLMRDEALLELQPAEWGALCSSFRVYRYKAILAAGIGRQDMLEHAIAEMRRESRGRPWESFCEETIQKLSG